MRILPGLVIGLLSASQGFSQQAFQFSAANMTSVLAEGREKTVLSGNAVLDSDSVKINADKVELSGKDFRFALATGNVTASDSDRGLLLRCQQLNYDRERKISWISGDSQMEDQKNEMVVRGGYLENYETDDLVIIQIGVRILKKDMTARSQYARFNRKTDTLELSGLPVVIYKGDEYRARRITVNIKTNQITMDGQVSGSVVRSSSKSPPAAVPEPAPKSEPQTPSPLPAPKPPETPEAKP